MPTSSEEPLPHSASFEIISSTGRYNVDITPQAFDDLLAKDDGDRVFIVDAFLSDRIVAAGHDPIIIAADETAKSLDRMTDLIVALRDRRTTRATTLIAIGGGVVQDAAAFAAAIYMRGIEWVYVPTTLLSMTDSCIGGKSSINVGPYKNIVGTYHPPERVLIDPALVATLSTEQVAAGLLEAVKICLCRGPETFDHYLALDPHTHSTPDELAAVVVLSLKAKKWFIEIDEFDREERLILNFGHTFGHALEAASDFAISHGIAIGLGMLAAIEMGVTTKHSPRLAAFRCHVGDLVATVDGLEETLAKIDPATVMTAFEADKKHGREFYAVILSDAEGRIERKLLPRTAATRVELARAITAMLTPLWRNALFAA